MQALTQPALSTYERLLQDPQATVRRVCTWVAVAALIAYFISMTLHIVLNGTWQESMLGPLGCGAVVVPFLSVLGFAISAGFTHLAARALGGTGTYPELAYAYATYQAPLALVSGILILSAIPYLGYLNYAIALYLIVLNVLAVQAVHRFSRGKAIACAVVMPVLLGAIVACIVIGALVLLGPAIGNVYSTILEEGLMTPASYDGLVNDAVDDVAVTPDGVLWFATRGGVSRFDPLAEGEAWTSYTTADGLVHDSISVVEVAPDGAVWFGTEGGLMRYGPSGTRPQ